MLLAEELALIALNPDTGRFKLGTGSDLNGGHGIVEAPTGRGRPAWPLLDRGARDAVVARLQQAAQGEGPIEPRSALVLSMTGPAKLLELVAPDRDTRTHARRRIDHGLDGSGLAGVGKVVRKLIEDAAAAAMGVAR